MRGLPDYLLCKKKENINEGVLDIAAFFLLIALVIQPHTPTTRYSMRGQAFPIAFAMLMFSATMTVFAQGGGYSFQVVDLPGNTTSGTIEFCPPGAFPDGGILGTCEQLMICFQGIKPVPESGCHFNPNEFFWLEFRIYDAAGNQLDGVGVGHRWDVPIDYCLCIPNALCPIRIEWSTDLGLQSCDYSVEGMVVLNCECAP